MDIPKKVFVSYKYSDVVEGREYSFNFRDYLINKLGANGLMHKGEDEESFDMSRYTDEQIYNKIAPYIKNSSTTVVLITPNAIRSDWIPWEISLSLRERTYKHERNMTRNGIIGVYLPLNSYNVPDLYGDYSFYKRHNNCGTVTHFTDKFPKMIADNSFNLRNASYTCSNGCCTDVYPAENGSYIELVEWGDFINNIDTYIERAWNRRNNFEYYETRINLENGR